MDGTARLWSPATHRQIGTALKNPDERGGLYGIALSPDGRSLATADDHGRTRLWDTATHQQIGPALTDNDSIVRRVAFSPDGRLVVAAGDDGVVRLGGSLGSPADRRRDARGVRRRGEPGWKDPGHRRAQRRR